MYNRNRATWQENQPERHETLMRRLAQIPASAEGINNSISSTNPTRAPSKAASAIKTPQVTAMPTTS
jgi:hypothetical protein